MKTIITILMTILLSITSCTSQKKSVQKTALSEKQISGMELVYTANTRGFYQKITIKNQQLYVSKDRNSADLGTSSTIETADWNEIITYFKAVKLDALSTFKDPTQQRFYDGAAIANLKVNYEGKEYSTTDFDNGFPPVEIEKLVNKITSLVKKQ